MKKDNLTENHENAPKLINLKEQAKQNEEVFEISSTGYGLETINKATEEE